MSAPGPKLAQAHDAYRAILADFETLAALLDLAMERFAANGGGAQIERLERAKLAVERGRALARKALSSS